LDGVVVALLPALLAVVLVLGRELVLAVVPRLVLWIPQAGVQAAVVAGAEVVAEVEVRPLRLAAALRV
jgi:hypothetical protein